MRRTSTLTLDPLCDYGIWVSYGFPGKSNCTKSKAVPGLGIPAPVVGGLLVALILSYLKITGLFAVQWTSTLGAHLMNLFYLCGFWFQQNPAGARKKFCAGIALSVLLLVLLQGLLGMFLAQMLGLHPLLGIQIGTGALAGGVGTTSAFGPVYEGMGAVGATEIGVSGRNSRHDSGKPHGWTAGRNAD